MDATFEDRRQAAVPRGIASATRLVAGHALNSELWDDSGKRYIDFAAGIAVLNVGHRHPRVIEAVKEQIDRFTHTSFQVVAYEPYVRLAERLNAAAPFQGPARTLLVNSGSEAVENAVKIARMATGRSAVIAFAGAFHGRTLMATALTGKVANYKRGYGPMIPEVYHLPFPAAGPDGVVDDLRRSLDLLFSAAVDPERVAAIIVEPVQGEGGFHPAPDGMLRAIRETCDRHGILLIADEVQTGFARTGRMFAIEHSGVEPDLVCVAKGIGGGFPLAGVIGREAVMNAGDPGSLGSTYGGSPVACAAALAVLDIIRDERLEERAQLIGEKICERIRTLVGDSRLLPITPPRGLGAMIAFDILSDGGQPDPAAVREVLARAQERGLIILSCGAQGQAIRLLPPLTAPDEIIDEGLDLLEDALLREQAGAVPTDLEARPKVMST